jgi:hypothetical protein
LLVREVRSAQLQGFVHCMRHTPQRLVHRSVVCTVAPTPRSRLQFNALLQGRRTSDRGVTQPACRVDRAVPGLGRSMARMIRFPLPACSHTSSRCSAASCTCLQRASAMCSVPRRCAGKRSALFLAASLPIRRVLPEPCRFVYKCLAPTISWAPADGFASRFLWVYSSC